MKRLLLASIFLCFSSSALANLPFSTEDATTIGNKNFGLDSEFEFSHTQQLKYNNFSFMLSPKVGLIEPLEFGAVIPFRTVVPQDSETFTGFQDVSFYLKGQMTKESHYWPAALFKMSLQVPSGNYYKGLGSGGNQIGFTFAITKTVGAVTMHGNIGYVIVGNEKNLALHNYMIYGVAFELAITEKLKLLNEIYCQSITVEDIGFVEDDSLAPMIGLSYALTKKVIANTYLKINMTDQAVVNYSAVGTGLSVVF